MRVVGIGDDLHLVFVEFQDIGHRKDFLLALPLTGMHALTLHVAQISLHIDTDEPLAAERLHYLHGEVVGKQRAQVEHLRLQRLHLF